MSYTEENADQTGPKPDLIFYPGFNVKKTGDVIARAENSRDNIDCFYFRLPLLAEFSSFFRDLPSPSPDSDDIHDGLAVIPLLGATAGGLAIYFEAILELVQGISNLLHFMLFNADDIFNAAVLAETYDTPAVRRQLLLALHSSQSRSDRKALRYFGVIAIGRRDDDMASLGANAVSTLDSGCVTDFPEEIEALEKYAPNVCRRLIKFHLRCASALIAIHHRDSDTVVTLMVDPHII